MAECDRIQKIIPKYVAHTCDENESALIEEHLCTCSSCRRFLGKIMEQPSSNHHHPESIPIDTPTSKVTLWEYVALSVGGIMLVFFIYLMVKT